MMWNWGGSGGWGMGFGRVFMILFWGLVILGIVALVRWLVQQSQPGRELGEGAPAPGKTPLEIVRERYARGEIDREEYEQKKRDLEA